MAKKKFIPQLIGKVGRDVANIMVNAMKSGEKLEPEEAIVRYKEGLSKKSKMRDYDFANAQDEIIENAMSRLDEDALAKVEAKSKKSKKKPKKKSKKKTKTVLSNKKKMKFLKPELIKITGKSAKIVEDDDEGYYVEKTDETEAVGLKCPFGSEAKRIDEKRAGCVPK